MLLLQLLIKKDPYEVDFKLKHVRQAFTALDFIAGFGGTVYKTEQGADTRGPSTCGWNEEEMCAT